MRRKQRSDRRVMAALTQQEYNQLMIVVDYIADNSGIDMPATISNAIRFGIIASLQVIKDNSESYKE